MVIGFLGVGHLAECMISGLLRAGQGEDLLLSPRGRAGALAARYGIAMARDNADLVTRSTIVVLAVRPADAEAAVTGLPWRAEQVVVSACAGVPAARLPVAPARIQRIMPVTAAEIGASPTVCFPDLAETRPFLAALGPVIPLEHEAEFEIATVSAAVYGWAQDLVKRTAEWSSAQGLARDTARRLAAHTFVAAGSMIAARPEPMTDLMRALVTPGGITELGLNVLAKGDVPQTWDAACDAVLARLNRA